MSNKIINSLQERRQVEEAVARLADLFSEPEMVQEVQKIARDHAPSLVLPAIRRHLNTDSSRLRGGLGRLAAQLGGAETVAMLRKEAGRRDNPTQTRLTAAAILERFLQVEVSAGLMGDLRDPNLMVMQSLQEAVEEGKANRHVLLEYVRQMRQENQDVAFLVLSLIDQLAEEDQPELLRLIAYDSRTAVAEAALGQLSGLRDSATGVHSADALHTLQSSLRPELAQAAARNLRKLRLAGVRWESVPADDWWALISPCDYQGTQHLWFLGNGGGTDRKLVGLRINRIAGILEGFGSENVDGQHLPPRRQIGEMLSISLAPGENAVFLSIPYTYGRQCLQHSLESHWRASTSTLPEEFTLYCPYLFRHSLEPISPQLSSLLASGPELWAQAENDLPQVTMSLLGHPAMANWVLSTGNMGEDISEPGGRAEDSERGRTGLQPLAGLPMEELAKLARNVVSEEVPQELSEQLRQALLAQAGWLHYAGHQSFARHAVCVAESLNHKQLHSHPLLLQMIALGFLQSQDEGGAPKGPE